MGLSLLWGIVDGCAQRSDGEARGCPVPLALGSLGGGVDCKGSVPAILSNWEKCGVVDEHREPGSLGGPHTHT